MKLIDLKAGQRVAGARVVFSNVTLRQTKSTPPREFVTIALTDGTAEIEAKIWNWQRNATLPEAKKVYFINGDTSEYQGQLQLTLTSHLLDSNQDMTDFVPSNGIDLEAQWLDFKNYVNTAMSDCPFRLIVTNIYAALKASAMTAVSACGIHHDYVGGNLQHTLEVARTAVAIAKTYPDYTINKDLLIAGALLHDIGKLQTYTVTGPVIDYSADGMLFDHIVLGISMLNEYALTSPTTVPQIRLLTHIIASHHGVLEYGSPVMPKFIEAYIVNMADGISATLNTLNTAYKKAGDKVLTEKLYTQGNRPNFTPKFVEEVLKDAQV